MTTMLLFGVGGQLGQELITRAAASRFNAVGRTHAEVDISDESGVEHALLTVRPDIVVNAGGYTKVDKAESEPEEAFKSNMTGPAVLARACKRARVCLVHISTDYVFSGDKSGGYVETDPTAPLGVYGVSKAKGEEAVRAELDRHVILRTSWIYGSHGANFAKTILHLARDRDEIRVVADQYGCPTSTIDLAEAIFRVARSMVQGTNAHGTYHFAGQGRASWHDFASVIAHEYGRLSGHTARVIPITTAEYPTAARRPRNSELDCSLFANTFGFYAAPWEMRVRDFVRLLWESEAE